MRARVVNVILVESGEDRSYFTLEGVPIGKFMGARQVQEPATKPTPPSPKSSVVKAPTPKEIKRAEAKHNDEMMKVENRIPINE